MRSRSCLRVLAATLVAALPCAADEPAVSLARLDLDRSAPGIGEVRVVAAGGVRFRLLGSVEIDGEGRIVVLGSADVDGVPPVSPEWGTPAVARFFAHGGLDPSFGDGGITVLPVGGRAGALAVDAEDRAVVLGTLTEDPADVESPRYIAARLDADGRLDAAFGDAGLVPMPLGAYIAVGAVADRSDSSVVVLGDGFRLVSGEHVSQRVLMRITAAGQFDPGWGDDGIVPAGFRAADIAIAGDGSVFAADDGGVVRFSRDGQKDLRFGDFGVLLGAKGHPLGGRQIETDAAGRLVLLGSDGHEDSGFFRFSADGTLDETFGEGGFRRTRYGAPGNSEGHGLPVMAVGRGESVRYVQAMGLRYATADMGSAIGWGHIVQSFDPLRPGVVASHVTEVPGEFEPADMLFDVAVTADGGTAVAVGFSSAAHALPAAPLLLRVDLTRETPLPLPNLRVRWDGRVKSHRRRFRTEIEGVVRVTNTSDVAVGNARVTFLLSRDTRDDYEDPSLTTERTGRIEPGATVTVRLPTGVGFERRFSTKRIRLLAVIDREHRLPQSDETDDVAVSQRLR